MDSHIIPAFAAALCFGLVFLMATVDFTANGQRLPYEINEIYFEATPSPIEGTSIYSGCYCFLRIYNRSYFRYDDDDEFDLISLSLQKDNVNLTRNGVVISTDFINRINIEPHFDIFFNEFYVYTTISPVMRNDSGLYGCLVFDSLTNRIEHSNQQVISVLYYPNTSYPQCTPAIQRAHIGSQTTLRCVSEEGNPPVSLQWGSQNEALNKSSTQRQETVYTQNGLIISELQLTTTFTDINDEYTCEIHSSTFPEKLQTCSIVLQLTLPYSVSVYPFQVHVNSGESVQFECRIRNTLETSEAWDWNTEPSLDQSKVLLSDRNTLQIRNVEKSDNGTVVFCHALLDGQWFHSTGAILFVQEKQSTLRRITETPDQLTSSSPTGWIAGFVVILILFIISIGIIISLFLRFNKKPLESQQTRDPVTAKPEDKQTHDIETTYTGLQRSEMNAEGQDYTELNTIKPTNADEHEYSYANVNESKLKDNEEEYYEYPAETKPKMKYHAEQHQYGNVK